MKAWKLITIVLTLVCAFELIAACDTRNIQLSKPADKVHDYPDECPLLAIKARDYLEFKLIPLLDSRDVKSIKQELPPLTHIRDSMGRCASMEYYNEQTKRLSDFYADFSSRLALLVVTTEIGAQNGNAYVFTDAYTQVMALRVYLNSFEDLQSYLTVARKRQPASQTAPEVKR